MDQTITDLLQRAREGDGPASDELWPLIYAELHRLAHVQHARSPATLLDTTALVHEACLKLVHQPGLSWPDRRHCYAYAARAMRTFPPTSPDANPLITIMAQVQVGASLT